MKRDLTTLEDLTNEEIEAIFRLADEFVEAMGDGQRDYRVTGRTSLAEGKILSTLFYESSTRTRFSFESAMLRLGGQVLAFADPAKTSASKGESIADTVRVIENYADVLVMRHTAEGAAQLAAQFTHVPVINGGDGRHEHPTQTLCDLYTLRREKGTLKGLSVLLCGDLKYGRTTHSLAFALARFGSNIIPLPGKGLGFPDHVRRRLERDYNCTAVPPSEHREILGSDMPVDVVYVTPTGPHQLSLLTNSADDDSDVEQRIKLAQKTLANIDVCYVTRLQRERMEEADGGTDYPVVDKKFLSAKRYRNAQVMHPLPRVDELAYDLDKDPRGVYFKQAAYGVPVRMALMASLLQLKPGVLRDEMPAPRYEVYASSKRVLCENPQCVTNLGSEQQYSTQKFWVIDSYTIRCSYCDHERRPRSRVAHVRAKAAERDGTPVETGPTGRC
jgi:aspartate carbamoyltransferase catalytic subunit